MIEILGRVMEITTRTVTISQFDYEAFLNPEGSFEGISSHDRFYISTGHLKLPYREEIADNLIESLKNNKKAVFKFTINNGVVTSAVKFRYRDALVKLAKVIEIINGHDGIEPISLLCLELKEIEGFERNEVLSLVEQLKKEGILCELRSGLIQLTRGESSECRK